MSSQNKQDNIYATPVEKLKSFAFDDRVASVFPDMIGRSVPGYATVINMSSILANQYAQADTHCYDLGCSLGATTLALEKGIGVDGCHIVAVDNSQAMLEKASQAIQSTQPSTPIELVHADIRDIDIQNASVVSLNYTLQFIPVDERPDLIEKIYAGLVDKGILILSEKIAFEEDELEQLQIEMHHAFKRANGYNDLEISQKRSALENILIPEPLETHRRRLLAAGFQRADLWFQCFNFISLVAVK